MVNRRKDNITVDFRIDRETYERFKACLVPGLDASKAIRSLIEATIAHAARKFASAMPEDLPT